MTTTKSKIAFVSCVSSNLWGGSEELWSKAAIHLSRGGVSVAVNLAEWSSPHPILSTLVQAGVGVSLRPIQYNFVARAWRNYVLRQKDTLPILLEFKNFIDAERPSLVVLSDGVVLPPVELMELCLQKQQAFVTIGHQCPEHWWPDDDRAHRLRGVLPAARRCFFVAKSSQSLVERRLSIKLSNAEVVRNPFNVAFDAAPPWPKQTKNDELQLACVGRLDPAAKGQDILLEVLAQRIWQNRPWRLSLYGDGPQRNCLFRMSERLGLSDRVGFAGHVHNIEKVWEHNHALVLTSRHEGLPLSIVEAMLCGRPVVATDVGGIKEIIEDGVTGFIAKFPNTESVQDALERLWARRSELKHVGHAAAKRIRELVPADPAKTFSERLLQLV